MTYNVSISGDASVWENVIYVANLCYTLLSVGQSISNLKTEFCYSYFDLDYTIRSYTVNSKHQTINLIRDSGKISFHASAECAPNILASTSTVFLLAVTVAEIYIARVNISESILKRT